VRELGPARAGSDRNRRLVQVVDHALPVAFACSDLMGFATAGVPFRQFSAFAVLVPIL
jgi:hypothetical protein